MIKAPPSLSAIRIGSSCLPSAVTTAWVTMAPKAESANLLFSFPVNMCQIPMQLRVTVTAIPLVVDRLTESI